MEGFFFIMVYRPVQWIQSKMLYATHTAVCNHHLTCSTHSLVADMVVLNCHLRVSNALHERNGCAARTFEDAPCVEVEELRAHIHELNRAGLIPERDDFDDW
jgi:hypothetical protein